MPLYQTPLLPVNGGIDQRPIELRPNTTVDDLSNILVKPEGLFRRPPATFITDITGVSGPSPTTSPVYAEKADTMYIKGEPILIYIRIVDHSVDSTKVAIEYWVYNINNQSFTTGKMNIDASKSAFENTSELEIVAVAEDKILVIARDYIVPLIDDPNYPAIGESKTAYSHVLIKASNFTDGDSYTLTIYGSPRVNLGTITISYSATTGYSYSANSNSLEDNGTVISAEAFTVKNVELNTSGVYLHIISKPFVYLSKYQTIVINDVELPQVATEKIKVYFSGIVSDANLPTIVPFKNVRFKIGNLNTPGYWVTYDNASSSWYEDKTIVDAGDASGVLEVGAALVDTYELLQYKQIVDWKFPVFQIGFDSSNFIQSFTYLSNASTVAQRYIGDDIIAPHPSFTKYPIKDVFIFQGRLWILTSNSLVASRANDYLNFYPKSAVSLSADDPIDIEIDSGLQYAVLYQNSILIVGKQQQYLVTASSGVFTIETIAVTPTTTYDLSESIRPQNLGDTVLLIGDNNNLYEYMSKYETVQTEAIRISEGFIPKTIIRLLKNSSYNIVLLQEDDYSFNVLTYKNIQDSLYRVFGKWNFKLPIKHVVMYNDIYLIAEVNSKYLLFKIDMSILDLYKLKESQVYYLDFQDVDNSPTITYDGINDITTITIQGLDYGANITPDVILQIDSELYFFLNQSHTNGTMTITLDGDYSNASSIIAYIGLSYASQIDFQQYFPKDENNRPLVFKRLTYRKITLHYIGVDFKLNYNNRYTLDNTGHFYDVSIWDTLEPTEKKIGVRLAGYKDNHIQLTSDSVFPLVITGVEYQLWYQSKL